MPADRTWWLYLIECRGGGLYTGIALDVEKRYQQHVTGKGARYTRMNPPVRVLARRAYPDHRSAAQAELAIKRLPCLEKWRWAAACCAPDIEPPSAVSATN